MRRGGWNHRWGGVGGIIDVEVIGNYRRGGVGGIIGTVGYGMVGVWYRYSRLWYRYSRVLYRYNKGMVQVKLGYGTGTVRLWNTYSSVMVRGGSVMVPPPPLNLSAHPYFSSLWWQHLGTGVEILDFFFTFFTIFLFLFDFFKLLVWHSLVFNMGNNRSSGHCVNRISLPESAVLGNSRVQHVVLIMTVFHCKCY